MQDHSLLVLVFQRGGPIMWAILAWSLVGWFIIFKKVLTLFMYRFDSAHVVDSIRAQIQIDGVKKTAQLLSHDDNWPADIIGKALICAEDDPDSIQMAVQAAASEHVRRLESGLGILAGLGTTATLLGLVGTVLGLIRMFNALSGTAITDPYLLSIGIAQALITTVSGLAVAIPFILIGHILGERVDAAIMQLEKVVLDLVSIAKNLPKSAISS